MIRDGDRAELERKLAQTRRLASTVMDRTTQRRLNRFRDELAESLRKYPGRRAWILEEQVRARAHELWEQSGKPYRRGKMNVLDIDLIRKKGCQCPTAVREH